MARQCTHKRRGIVVNESQKDGYRSDRAHASRTVCDQPACIEAGLSWVASKTNERAVHLTDKQLGVVGAA